MIRALIRVIVEKWWLIGVGILLGLLARAVLNPPVPESGWHFKTDLPAVRPEPVNVDDFPLTNHSSGDSRLP